jgi:hypothetical protein
MAIKPHVARGKWDAPPETSVFIFFFFAVQGGTDVYVLHRTASLYGIEPYIV